MVTPVRVLGRKYIFDMKKIYLCLLACCLLISCKPAYKISLPNPQQKAFDNFLAQRLSLLRNQNNDIQRKDFYNQFETDLYSYVDTVGFFVNWEGVIDNIETEESGTLTALKFTISYLPEENREVKFYCTHLIETDSLPNDYLYNTVKNMPNGLLVYFDGFIRTTNSGKVYYKFYSYEQETNIQKPKYEFWPIEIGPEERSNTLPTNLNKAVNICYEIIEPLRRNYLGEITKEQSDSLYNLVAPKFKEVKSQLTEEENGYISRLTTALTYNYLYGGNN